jgi:gamma-glutamylcyclotransferase (GGCT)/AIG2-like uncharacterized protein YtfP
MDKNCVKIFVYGTLKRGGQLNGHLEGQQFVGVAKTAPGYILYNLGWFPGMQKTGTAQVSGELWKVQDSHLRQLDLVEGSYFKRTPIELDFPYQNEEIQAYLYIGSVNECETCHCW